MFSKRVENTVGKGKNCSLRAISPFPTVFSKDLQVLQTRKLNQGLFRKGLTFLSSFVSELKTFQRNTTSYWLHHAEEPIRSFVIFHFSKPWRKRQRMFLRMVDEYGPSPYLLDIILSLILKNFSRFERNTFL